MLCAAGSLALHVAGVMPRGAAGGGSGKGLADNGDDDPSDLSDVTITIEPPAPASEVIMVENAAVASPSAEDTCYGRWRGLCEFGV